MEWTGKQQVFFFLQSICMGVPVGLCLDIVSCWTNRRARRRLLWTDVLFGPIAALLVFLGSLVIMDGQLHPLLVLGSFSGMAAEHLTLGALMRKMLKTVRQWMQKVKGFLKAKGKLLFKKQRYVRRCARVLCDNLRKIPKKSKN